MWRLWCHTREEHPRFGMNPPFKDVLLIKTRSRDGGQEKLSLIQAALVHSCLFFISGSWISAVKGKFGSAELKIISEGFAAAEWAMKWPLRGENIKFKGVVITTSQGNFLRVGLGHPMFDLSPKSVCLNSVLWESFQFKGFSCLGVPQGWQKATEDPFLLQLTLLKGLGAGMETIHGEMIGNNLKSQS